MYIRRLLLAEIQAYKDMLGHHVAHDAWRSYVDTLMISRTQLRILSDIELYQRAQEVLEAMRSMLQQSNKTASWYSGVDEFFEHFKHTLSVVMIHDGRLVHGPQRAAVALVHSIQILGLPMESCTAALTESLYEYGGLIASLGNREVQQYYLKLLSDHRMQDHALARTLLASFKQRLNVID